ncbi:MAG: phosphate ABC transporter ATP-binding protein [Candidatus Omnitrophota bacterium]
MVAKPCFEIRDLDVHFGEVHALQDVSFDIVKNEILGAIGPANSGKTTFLRALNRLNETQLNYRMAGSISLEGKDINAGFKAEELRRKVGMIFALPMPLPLSIYENVAFGPRRQGINDRRRLDVIVEESLQSAFLWEEVKDRLKSGAMKLSGGQQQRLCMARTLAVKPDVILFDEPCSGLDPISTAKVEESMLKLKEKYTIVLVTNNTKQAARVSNRVAFFLMGHLIELDQSDKIFTSPRDQRTEDYISGKFG